MRVAHIIKATRIAGAERHLVTLLPALRSRGVDVKLFLLVEPDKPVDELVAELDARGVPVERVIIRRHVDPGLIGRLRRVLRDFKPDIVHTHLVHADLYGVPAARLAGVKRVVMSRHNDDQFRRLLPFRLMNGVTWRLVDAGIAISDAIARFCVEVESAPRGKVHTIHYGLDMPIQPLDHRRPRADLRRSLNLPADAPVLGIVCRLITQKGIVYGLRGFARVAPEFPDAHLIIAGEGGLRSALESESKALGIASRVHFLGWRDDTAAIMAGIDMLLAPSLWEGFGLVLLEAMAQSTPIIASAVSAIPEIVVNGTTGLLVPPRDPAAVADAIRQLLTDQPLARHMGLLGQDRLETHFSAARMADETMNLYGQLQR